MKKVIKTRNLLIESLNKVLLKKIIEFSNSQKKYLFWIKILLIKKRTF